MNASQTGSPTSRAGNRRSAFRTDGRYRVVRLATGLSAVALFVVGALTLLGPGSRASGAVPLGAQEVAAKAPVDSGPGYWIVTSTGRVYAYGGASNYGGMIGRHLDKPIVGIASSPDGKGYWLFGADGGVFAFGDAAFYGSQGALGTSSPSSPGQVCSW